jgi:hypothetical protein
VVSSTAAAPARRKSVSAKRVTRPTVVEMSNAPVSEPEVLSVVAAAVVSETPAESYQDAVARLAYSYWAARGYQGGSPEADWLRAEQELRVK